MTCPRCRCQDRSMSSEGELPGARDGKSAVAQLQAVRDRCYRLTLLPMPGLSRGLLPVTAVGKHNILVHLESKTVVQ